MVKQVKLDRFQGVFLVVAQNEKITENLLVLVEPKQKLFRVMRERERFMKQNP